MTYIQPIHYQDTTVRPAIGASDHSQKTGPDSKDASHAVHLPSDEVQPDEQAIHSEVGYPIATSQEKQTASLPLHERDATLTFKDIDLVVCQCDRHSTQDAASLFGSPTTCPVVFHDNRGFLEVLSGLKGTTIMASLIKPPSSNSSMLSFFNFKPGQNLADTLTSEPSNTNPSNRSSALSTDLEKQHEAERNWKPGKQEWLVMMTLAVSSLTVALDATILVTVLPTLAKDLHGSATEAFWAGTSYLLTSAVVQPFMASLSDTFGRRELLVPSITLFLLGSIVCAVAHSFTTLLTGRVVQGIGGGGIITLAQIIYGDIVPLRQRPKYFALVLGTWALGTMFGPLIGGAFVEKATWRWCFYLNLPICGIALPMSFFLVKLQTERVSLSSKIRMVDWTGGILFIASLTSFLIGLSWAGVQYAWSTYNVLTPLILGATGISLTIVYETRVATNPFLIHSLFPNLSALATYTSAFFQGLILFTSLYYTSFYFLATKLESPINTGIDLFPATFLVLPGSIIVSALITRTGTYRWAVWGGWAIAAIGCGLFILWDEHTSKAVWATALCIFGLGTGMTLTSLNFAVQASVRVTKDSGRAAAMYAFCRTLGMTVGVAMGGTVFQNLMKHKLREVGLDTAIAKDAEGYVSTLHGLAVDDPRRVLALKGYVKGFQGVFIFMTAVSVVSLMVGALIKHFSLDKVLESRYSLDPEKLQQMAKGLPKTEEQTAEV